jgi:TRAP-type C4-dicarboxylate transport system permease small subunit
MHTWMNVNIMYECGMWEYVMWNMWNVKCEITKIGIAYVYVTLWIIGIPLLLYVIVQLLKSRGRLHEPMIILSLGFLYEG